MKNKKEASSLLLYLLMVVVGVFAFELVRPYYMMRIRKAGLHQEVVMSGACPPDRTNCTVFNQLRLNGIQYKEITTTCEESTVYLNSNHVVLAVRDAIRDSNVYLYGSYALVAGMAVLPLYGLRSLVSLI